MSTTIPARMSYEDCARRASVASRRMQRRIEQERATLAGRASSLYKGAEFSRLTLDWSATLAPPDEELRWSVARLRSRARDLARNNPYVRGYLNMLAVNVIGSAGMTLQAQVKDNSGLQNDRLNDAIEAGWLDWAQDVTVGTPLSLVRFEHQLLKTVAREGEVFVREWRGFSNRFAYGLEAIDPDLVDETFNRVRGTDGTNEVRMGVEVNQFGRPVAYHVWDRPQSTIGAPVPRRLQRIPANEILHLYDPDRVNQTRGVTWLASTMFGLKMIDGMDEAELVASRAAASKMGFFTRKGDELAGKPVSDDENALDMEANPGTFGILPPGYDFAQWDPQHPNAQYPAFIKAMLRKCATGLAVSYNGLANDLEGVNYSSMRHGLQGERDNWQTLQGWWIGAFRQRVYREWLGMALLAGAVRLDTRDFTKYLDVLWIPRGFPYVDPQVDQQTEIEGIDRGLRAPQDVVAARGGDLATVYRKLADAKKLAKQYGLDISAPEKQAASKPAATEPEPDEDGEKGAGASRSATGVKSRNRFAALLGNGTAPSRNGVHS